MNDPNVKILKLTSGEDIICKTFDECKDLKGRNISITDPVVLNQIRMPRGDMIVESYILSPWVALGNTESFEISTDHIIVAVDTKETLKEILSDPILQKSFNDEPLDVDKFISDLGMKKDGKQYWLKLRTPLKDGQRLFNSRGKTPEDLEKFIS